MSRVALFFMPPAFGGGSTSYTVHLYRALQLAGHEPRIYRVKPKSESVWRPFSKYEGVTYQNITAPDAKRIVKDMPSLLTAPTHSKHLEWAPDIITQLMDRGMRVVVHDPNEFKVFDHLANVSKKYFNPICIRPTMREFYPEAVFIHHPYVRHFGKDVPKKRELTAVSVARISFVKRTAMILEANRLLPEKYQCVLRGAENRLYTRHVLTKKFPEFKQGGYGFPMTWGASAVELSFAKFGVDLTLFPNDGGGSQYSFMEAWDAGTINVIHEDWLRYPGEMRQKFRCVAIDSPTSLAAVLKNVAKYDLEAYQQAGYSALKRHEPKQIATMYMQELNR